MAKERLINEGAASVSNTKRTWTRYNKLSDSNDDNLLLVTRQRRQYVDNVRVRLALLVSFTWHTSKCAVVSRHLPPLADVCFHIIMFVSLRSDYVLNVGGLREHSLRRKPRDTQTHARTTLNACHMIIGRDTQSDRNRRKIPHFIFSDIFCVSHANEKKYAPCW